MVSTDRDPTLMKHVALLLLLAVIWSSSFTMIKVAVESVPPITLVAARLAIAAIFLTLFLIIQGKRLPVLGRKWVPFFMVAFTGNSVPFFLITWGEVGIDSGLAAILMAVMPLTTLVLAHFYTESDRITPVKFIGLSIGFIGVLVLVGPDLLSELGGHFIREMAVAGAAIFYAITTVLIRRMPSGGDPIERSSGVMICAAMQMVPLSLIFDQPWTLDPTLTSMMANLYIGLFPTALAAIIHFHIVAERGTTFFTMINYIIPCMGVTWGAIFLAELVTWNMVLALVIILCGIAITNIKKRAI